MGTFATITAVGPSSLQVHTAVDEGYRVFDRVNQLMSDYTAASEIGLLNQSPAQSHAPLALETFTCLTAAAEFEIRSDGAFTITCRPLVQLWKAAGRRGQLPSPSELEAARELVGQRFLQWHEPSRLVGLLRDGVQVDLGGIAKGYALDLAREAMLRAGATGGLIDLGGGIFAFGRNELGEPWRVGVRHPFADGVIAVLRLEDRSVATSGLQQRYFEIAGRRYSHIIDPRTGWPAEQTACVTVIASDGMTADAWATAFSVLSVAEGMALLRRPDAPSVEVMWVTGDAARPVIEMTPGFRNYLAEDDALQAVP